MALKEGCVKFFQNAAEDFNCLYSFRQVSETHFNTKQELFTIGNAGREISA
jgi:hypothetical protein